LRQQVGAPLVPTVSDTLSKIVNASLKGCRDVGDSLRDAAKSPTINSIGTWLAAACSASVILIFINGGITAQNDVRELKTEFHEQALAIGQIRDSLRPEDWNRHLSAQDGRLDAIEGRLLRDEERIIRATTLLDQIDAANRQRMLPRP
jgi:hypothetical protein